VIICGELAEYSLDALALLQLTSTGVVDEAA